MMAAQAAQAVVEEGITPRQFLLTVMRDESKPLPLRIEAAKAAAPYCHARLTVPDTRNDAAPAPTIGSINLITVPSGHFVNPETWTNGDQLVIEHAPITDGAAVE